VEQLPKYIYTVILDVMEKTYSDNAQTPFFKSDEEREAFNAELVINAKDEAQADQIRIGMTDTRMWELNRTE
jgi:flagellar basal body rod protein FlgB